MFDHSQTAVTQEKTTCLPFQWALLLRWSSAAIKRTSRIITKLSFRQSSLLTTVGSFIHSLTFTHYNARNTRV